MVGSLPVEGLQQDLEGALVGEGQLAEHDGAARGALMPRLDEVRQQPAMCSALPQPMPQPMQQDMADKAGRHAKAPRDRSVPLNNP